MQLLSWELPLSQGSEFRWALRLKLGPRRMGWLYHDAPCFHYLPVPQKAQWRHPLLCLLPFQMQRRV